MHPKIQPAKANDRTPSNGKKDSKTHRILQQKHMLLEIWSKSVTVSTIHVQQFGLTWYRFIVYRMTERGIETPTIACVDGIPYSSAHFFCRRTTGGQEGRGHRTTSLIPWPKIPKHNIMFSVHICNQTLLTVLMKYAWQLHRVTSRWCRKFFWLTMHCELWVNAYDAMVNQER